MSDRVSEVTEATWQSEVLDSESPVVVDFWAPWCGPCRMVAPVMDQLAEKHDSVKVMKCNVDENANLASQFQVMSIPTVGLFKGGQIKERMTGFQPKEKLAAKVTPHV